MAATRKGERGSDETMGLIDEGLGLDLKHECASQEWKLDLK